MSLIKDNLVYEISVDDCHSWSKIDHKEAEELIRKSYSDGGLMVANLQDGLIVVTPFGKFRARSRGTPYLRRGTGVYHKMIDDKISVCGAASIDNDFEIVYRVKVLESMTCINCLIGRKTR